jgi:hypothetical protein
MAFHPHLATDGSGLLAGGRVHPEVGAQIAAQRGRGAPLPADVRDEMGGALGDAFGDVRVHTDPLAGALARSVQARAFTTGSDIFFAADAYEPASSQGRALLAHELAHVVQQRGTPTSGEMRVSEPGDHLEQQAERAAGTITSM